MELERNAYVAALVRFTLLTAEGGAAVAAVDMKAKNVATIRTLISVAQHDGNLLATSWLDILRCVSQLEMTELFGSLSKQQSATGGQQVSNRRIKKNEFQLISYVQKKKLRNNTFSSSLLDVVFV